MCAVAVMADCSADTRHLAGRDSGADTRAADEDPALGPALLNRLTELLRLVRIVDPDRVGVGAEVDHLVTRQRLEHGFTQVNAAMIEGDCELHRTSTRAILPSSNVKRTGRTRPSSTSTRAIA